ncbi:MAG: hypothetical protein CSA47_02220 [Gammaproteobacteria bacterium]|nr:MAG: hypothetical protein CSA47_02220 [Gammaproteobacteria bacterium]
MKQQLLPAALLATIAVAMTTITATTAMAKDVAQPTAQPSTKAEAIKSNQKVYNLGLVDSKKMSVIYPGFVDSFDKAFIGLPKGFADLSEPFYGTLKQAKEKIANLEEINTTYPTVLYMQGSGSFSKGPTFRQWITGDAGWVFFAPNTHVSSKRSKYSSPVPKKIYEEIHKYRQAEIDQFVKRLDELPFVDRDRMFLMGNSEGALAAARYAGREFVGRLVLSWTCEPGYYTDFPKVGSKYKTDPFLNIVGRDDVYFGKDSPYNNQYRNKGHCGDALLRYQHAKVVLLPNTGHNVMKNPFTKDEVISFLDMFKDHRVNLKKQNEQEPKK